MATSIGTIYRDTPKQGETDALWCFTISENGHVVHIKTGYTTQEDAWVAMMFFEATGKNFKNPVDKLKNSN